MRRGTTSSGLAKFISKAAKKRFYYINNMRSHLIKENNINEDLFSNWHYSNSSLSQSVSKV
jgi:hypothetical protein